MHKTLIRNRERAEGPVPVKNFQFHLPAVVAALPLVGGPHPHHHPDVGRRPNRALLGFEQGASLRQRIPMTRRFKLGLAHTFCGRSKTLVTV
jgi:hypothetical protein